MIFVTVGTHEQPFNRLVETVDKLKSDGTIANDESVFIQTGFSTYEPKYCEWTKLLSYADMQKYMHEARIIITHGGPSSFMMALQLSKIPIVVPRRVEYGEHVNNHQLQFCRAVSKRYNSILLVEDLEMLAETITRYDELTQTVSRKQNSNNERFNTEFEKIVENIF